MQKGNGAMVVQLVLAAANGEREETTVSTTLSFSTADPRWPARLVETIAGQAQEGARRLRDQLVAQEAIPGDGFVPLAAVVPAVETGR